MIGKRFQFLTVLSETRMRDKRNVLGWKCLCDCGKTFNVYKCNLKLGHTESCGCMQIKNRTKHSLSKTKVYAVWIMMKARCLNKNNKSYEYYGGRGITVCKRWMKFENFIKDMGERPNNLTLERINNNKGYSPSNCKWATMSEQAKNRRATAKE